MLSVRQAVEDNRAKPSDRKRAADELRQRHIMASTPDEKIGSENRRRLFKEKCGAR